MPRRHKRVGQPQEPGTVFALVRGRDGMPALVARPPRLDVPPPPDFDGCVTPDQLDALQRAMQPGRGR
jgi:hypothetical protein